MKQNIFTVIFLLLSTVCKAQTFIYPQNDSILTEYNDGKFWAYLNKNNFVVGLSCFEEKDDYGKYYHLDIFIKNLSETPIVFQPDSVHANLLTKKDDTLKLEVYHCCPEKFYHKVGCSTEPASGTLTGVVG